jgi:hypothetical protein
MAETSNGQANPTSTSSITANVDSSAGGGGPAPQILQSSSPSPSSSSYPDSTYRTTANGHATSLPEKNGGPLGGGVGPKEEETRDTLFDSEEGWVEEEKDDQEWDDGEQQGGGINTTDDEDDSAGMSSWFGQPSVKGSTEVMRMVLLTFNSVGMTFVLILTPPPSLVCASHRLTDRPQLYMGRRDDL